MPWYYYAIAMSWVFLIGLALGHSQARRQSLKTIKVVREANLEAVDKNRASYYNMGWDDCKRHNFRERLLSDIPKPLEDRIETLKKKIASPTTDDFLSEMIDQIPSSSEPCVGYGTTTDHIRNI